MFHSYYINKILFNIPLFSNLGFKKNNYFKKRFIKF